MIRDIDSFKCFSVFDHRLTNEEAENQVLFYQQALEEGDTPKPKQYYKYHDKFVKFYLNLYNQTEVYGILYVKHSNRVIAAKFDNAEEYIAHIIPSVREQSFLTIALPEFYSVIRGNFDLVHLLYTLKTKSKGFQKIASIIKSNGLFILD